MKKVFLRSCLIGVVVASILTSCATLQPQSPIVETYGFDTGIKASQTIGGVSVTAQYVATDSWDWVLKNSDLNAMLAVPHAKFLEKIQADGLEAYQYASYALQEGDNNYFFPIVANMNAFLITITNNTKGVIKMRDLRVGFITSDGERYNNMTLTNARDWLNDAAVEEIKKQKAALSSNWTPTMDLYIGSMLLEGKVNRKFKVINDPDAEIYPGETFKGFALFDGGAVYDSKTNKVTYLDSAKLGVYEVPTEVDEKNTIVKKDEFIFNVKKVSADRKAAAPEIAPPIAPAIQ